MISRKQIILISSAVSLVTVLLVFPIGVVKQDRKEESVKVQKADTVASTQAHMVEIPKALRTEIDQLEADLKKNSSALKAEQVGDAFARATAYDSAIYYYEIAAQKKDNLAIKIKTADAYYHLFGITEGQDAKVAQKCKTLFKEILNITPSNMEVKARLGYITTLTSEAPMEGVGILNQVLEVEPDNRTALFNLGLLGIRSRQFEKAKARFEKILTKDSEDQVARFYLAVCYKETNDLAKVRELVNIITQSDFDPVLISESKKLLVE